MNLLCVAFTSIVKIFQSINIS